MRLLLIVLLFTSSLLAQYTKNDYNLVKTTFLRQFDKSIITSYLESDESLKVEAALLAISNSNDSSFIPQILNLNFNENGIKIAYTLGKLPRTDLSIKYLFSKLSDKNSYKLNKQIFEAIGQIGNTDDLDKLLDGSLLPTDGKALAYAQFAMRKIESKGISLSELFSKSLLSNSKEIFEDNLWAFLRLGGDSSKTDLLKSVALDKEHYTQQSRIYSLQILNRLKLSPLNLDEISNLLNDTDWRIRNEAIKLIKYSQLDDQNLISLFNLSINDKNPNVSREFAKNIVGIKFNDKTKLSDFLKTQLDRKDLPGNTIGELFNSYCTLFPNKYEIAVNEYSNTIPMEYIINSIGIDTLHSDFKMNYLSQCSDYSNPLLISSYTNSLLSFQNIFFNDANYKKLIFDLFSNNSVVGVGILSYDLDSLFIAANKEELKKSLKEIITRNVDHFGFSESLISLTNISSKIDSSFNQSILQILQESEIPSVSNYSKIELGIKIKEKEGNNDLFEEIWLNAFSYQSALVKTNKGEFVFKFTPEFCPISVGNFIKLTNSNYFNGVIFHRVVPNFVIQTGDTTSTGWGGPGYEIVSEFSDKPYLTGSVGMASAGKDTEGSQWFVIHSAAQHLNGRYSNFGTIISGQEVVDMIDQGDRILSITLKK